MDEKIEDKSEESKKNHIKYYKSLTKIIQEIQKEKVSEKKSEYIKHLNDRIDAIEQDKERIRKMFPEVEW